MSCGMVAGKEQAVADANLQYAISLLHPFLKKLLHSNPITKKKLGNKETDFSQSLQAIIEDWKLLYPAGSKFAGFQKYFSRAKQVRHWVAHQSFDRNRYQHYMECLANVATAIVKPDLNKIILNRVVVKDDEKENQDAKNKVNNSTLILEEGTSFKEEGNQLYKEERWSEAMNCYTRAIHLNQKEAVLYSNRALCKLHLSKLDLAREDIEDAIQLDPKNVKYFRVLSDVLLQMKMHEESLTACLQGLEIDPRDELLNIRERDCRALVVSDLTDQNRASIVNQSVEPLSRCKNLHLTSEDIEDCANLDAFNKLCHTLLANEGHQLERGEMSSSSENSQERKAFDIFKTAAKKGSADGLYSMALFYSQGKGGLERDFNKTIELCRKAASQKAFYRFKGVIIPYDCVAAAEAFLGDCYRDGRGVERNTTEAFKWFLKAAQHDSPSAQNNLGLLLMNGDGCSKNEVSARYWIQKAAEQGVAVAQFNYAMMLVEGRGGPTDAKKAGELLQLSADQGQPGALERLQKLSMSGALGGSNIEKTKENLKKTAQKGDPSSLFLLAQNYMSGTGGFDKDLRQAELLLRQASKTGYVDAHLPLGKLLIELKKNEEAFEFIKLSAERGSAEGQFELGTLFAYGHGCARDEAKARRWLNRAKQQGLDISDQEDKVVEDWVVKEIDCGREISEFETQQLLKTEGMALEERKRRFISSMLKKNDPLTSTLEHLRSRAPDSPDFPTINVRSLKELTPECVNEMISRAKNGSATAKLFFKACEKMEQAIYYLARQQTTDAFKLFRSSLRMWTFPSINPEFIDVAKLALDRNSKDADALYVLASLDTTMSMEEKLPLIKRCVELDPTVPDFYHFLAWSLSISNSTKNGLRAIDRAIEMLPSHLAWLYDRALLLRLKEEAEKKKNYSIEIAEAYLKFISSNPTDHRYFPEACYCLAEIYLLSNEECKGKMYCQKGLDAEKIRLPCFEPVDFNHPAKMMTRMLLKGLKKRGDPAAAQEKTITNCANCFKSNQSFRCTACKIVWYCDRACQVAHWKTHKVDCKRVTRS